MIHIWFAVGRVLYGTHLLCYGFQTVLIFSAKRIMRIRIIPEPHVRHTFGRAVHNNFFGVIMMIVIIIVFSFIYVWIP